MKQKVFFSIALLCGILFLLTSCSEDRTNGSYRTHPNGWNYEDTDEFHGPYAVSTASQSCAACHGSDFLGGESGVSCYECHAGYPHPRLTTSPTAHATELAAIGWPMTQCQSCHGTDFAGGKVGVGCLGCHTADDGPAACNTCHAEVPINNAGLLQGMPSGSFGAHELHVIEKGYACTECHARVTDVLHTGPLPAEVSFAASRIARKPPYTSPVYSHIGDPVSGNGSCSATYCHSDGRGGPPPIVLPWVGGESYCTACHNLPPPAPHPQQNECWTCHHNVDPNSVFPNDIRFLNPNLHVDGTVQF